MGGGHRPRHDHGARHAGVLPRDDTGLLYYGARYYDPVLGRFLSADPVGVRKEDPQSLNRYAYALNNPVNHTDPTGHQAVYPQPFQPQPTPGGRLRAAAPGVTGRTPWS